MFTQPRARSNGIRPNVSCDATAISSGIARESFSSPDACIVMLPWIPASVRNRLSTLSRRRTSVAQDTSIESSRPVMPCTLILSGGTVNSLFAPPNSSTSEAAESGSGRSSRRRVPLVSALRRR